MLKTSIDGILLLGGDQNGLNFEIEYYDDLDRYREAFYSVESHFAPQPIKNAQITLSGSLRFILGHKHYEVKLPGGCKALLAVRRPCILGGKDITKHFK